eukprot:INCI3160.1.p1 GENE.INCI3160.1~~INCI3160.1.p1  ORF type:complete len:434 (-),score=66.14 INCI3160.1:134-1435(-)
MSSRWQSRLTFGLSAVLAVTAPHSTAAKTGFEQPRFLLSFWVDPMVDPSDFSERYQEIRDANFTAVLGGFGATTPDQIQAQIAAAEANGLGAIVHADMGLNISDLPSSNSSAFWGYQLQDEPPASDFQQLADDMDGFAAARPDKLVFINLLPNYANAQQLGTPTYGEYVEQYVDTVQPDVLCMDHYPLFTAPDTATGNMTKQGYRDNLDVLRDVGLRKDLPFWNFFNVMPYDNHEDPTLAQIRWQAFTSLAYGSKGLLYFCYWTPPGFIGGGMITPRKDTASGAISFEKGPHYFHAQTVNSQVLAYESHLFNATSTGVCHLSVPANGTIVAPEAACQGTVTQVNITQRGYERDGELLFGQLDLSDGRSAVLVVNQDDGFNVWPTVTFAASLKNAVEVHPSTGLEVPVMDDSPSTPGLQLGFEAGGARLFAFGK